MSAAGCGIGSVPTGGRVGTPSAQIEGASIWGGVSDVELRGSRVRVYLPGKSLPGYTYPYVRWEGQLQVDSLAPQILSAEPLPELVAGDTLLALHLTATDTDSLWRARFIARRLDRTDSLVIPLTRGAGGNFVGSWAVPGNTAGWACYYSAEDMWENVASVPEGGHSAPWILWVGAMSAVPRQTSPVAALSFAVYPNPANASVVFQGYLPAVATSVQIVIYDLLGREVRRLPLTTIGAYHLIWDTRTAAGTPLPTGLYFSRLASPQGMGALKKIAIVR